MCILLDQLLSGLATVHAEGVVHRDIKPANILMDVTGTGRPHLRLSDFGISMRKGEPRLTETNYVVGTPGYFAPEQLLGAEPDFTADLFAVGLVALYLLQGRKPDSQALVGHFLTHGTPGAPEGVPEPLWQVLAGLLQPDPQARFRTATGARKALTAAVDMLPEPGPDEEPVEIFDQLGPLPSGFGPEGPTGAFGPAAPVSPAAPVGDAPAAALGGPVSASTAAAPGTVPTPATTPVPPRQQPQQPPQPHYRPQHPVTPATAPLASTAAAPAPLPGPSETGSFHLPRRSATRPPPSTGHRPPRCRTDKPLLIHTPLDRFRFPRSTRPPREPRRRPRPLPPYADRDRPRR